MPNSQIYRVFLLRSTKTEDAVFQFAFKQDPLLRPSIGDVITNPKTFGEFKILHDEIPIDETTIFRADDTFMFRITDTGDRRITQEAEKDPADVTHNYFVTPANNVNRISSYSTNTFADDQTLRQLFR